MLGVKARDSQRSKLYKWEAATFVKSGEDLTLDQCKVLAHEAVSRYGFTNFPVIKDGRGRRNAGGSEYEIDLPRWARNRFVVLHEAAHAIVDMLARRHNVPRSTWAGHGAEFTRVFVSLLDAYGVKPKTGQVGTAAVLARRAGLKVAAPGGLVPMPATQFKRYNAAVAAVAAVEAERRALAAKLNVAENERTNLKSAYIAEAKTARGAANRAAADRRARGKALAASRGGGFGTPVPAPVVSLMEEAS